MGIPAVLTEERFHDPGLPLESYLEEVLVECPSCRGRAVVRRIDTTPPWPSQGDWLSDRRLTCPSCGAVRTWPAPEAKRWVLTGTDVDPWFRLPLWYRVPACGHTVWAYGDAHLELLRRFVAARHRTREAASPRIHSVVSRLPAWFKVAGNRQELLRALDRAEARR